MCYKSLSAASIISCNLPFLKCVSYGTSGLETSTYPLKKYLMSGFFSHHYEALHGWHNQVQTLKKN